MRAAVFHGVGDVRLEKVKDPELKDDTDAIVKITRSAICGTDLHMIRGTMAGMKPGTVLGHEGVGVVEDVGKQVRNFREGDRVVIPSTIACGTCLPCRGGFFSQCDKANPNGPAAGTAFFGGPAQTGPFDGLQAERQRIPYAHVGLVKLPDQVSDDQAILLSDIFPTGYFGADLAQVRPGSSVAVLGCGPVGQFAIASALMMGASRVLAVDTIPDRLEAARRQGAECIDFGADDPVLAVQELTGGAGVDCVIDAVGIDANAPGWAPRKQRKQLGKQVKEVAPDTSPHGDNWHPGDAPAQALQWAVEIVAKAGTVAVVGVYPEAAQIFPIGRLMGKNLTLRAGNCNHRKYMPLLLEKIRTGAIHPTEVITQEQPLESVVDAYKAFDTRQPGWLKVELQTAQ